MPTDLKENDSAPEFRTSAVGGEYGEGQEVTLSELRGSIVVLYFYPKDDTPGCTVQACGLRDSWGGLKKRAKIFGVSVDPATSHRKFIDKFGLPFPLLADPERKIVSDYGVWVEKSFMGKKHMGVERSTFVIGPDGRIVAILRKVKPDKHVELLAETLTAVERN